MLGCSRSRVFQLLRAGTLERAPRYGRALRIYQDSVERALARTVEPARAKRKASIGSVPVARRENIRF
jgi:hypothetical protein